MKNSIDTIGNRTRDLPICSAVPQPTAPPRGPDATIGEGNYSRHFTGDMKHGRKGSWAFMGIRKKSFVPVATERRSNGRHREKSKVQGESIREGWVLGHGD